jgi:hypothetical protein
VPTNAELELLTALAWMCEQYLNVGDDGLDHKCMSAGERAIKLLHQYGLVDCNDRGAGWTDAGETLLAQS